VQSAQSAGVDEFHAGPLRLDELGEDQTLPERYGNEQNECRDRIS
jgi:hypothetical protein